jgi:hypothetical protein
MRWLQTVEGNYATVRTLDQAIQTRFNKLMKNVAYRLDTAYENPISYRIRLSRAYLKGLLGCVL